MGAGGVMADEEQLTALLHEAASSVEPPPGAGASILERAAQPASGLVPPGLAERLRRRRRAANAGAGSWSGRERRSIAAPGTPARRRLVLACGLSLAAAGALGGVLAASGGAASGGFGVAAGVPAQAVDHAASGAARPVPAKATYPFPPLAPQALHRVALLPATPAPAGGVLGPQIVTTGSVDLGVRRAALAGDLARLGAVAARAGGFVSASDVVETGPNPGGSVTLRAPAARFSGLVAGTEAVGTVRSLHSSSDDVSSQVVDLAARITALEDARAQLEKLLARTGKISDLLSVENEITATQTQIEQLQGEQRSLDEQVAYSTLTVELDVVNPPKPPPSHAPRGFAAAWHHALRGFVGGVRATVADLGVVLFAVLGVVVLGALAVLLGRLAWRLIVRRFA